MNGALSTPRKILLLGHTGKLGTALAAALSGDLQLICRNSRDFDASDPDQVDKLISVHQPDLIINTVAFLGIDPCERSPDRALRLNTLYPRQLAIIAEQLHIPLVHFSTDAVFNDVKGDYYTEDDTPAPLHIYGLTKYGGDCFVQAECSRHYIFRVPIMFGDSSRNDQFVEKMLNRIKGGEIKLQVSGDIVSSPTYSRDVARRVRELILGGAPYGLYHLANAGRASLYEFMVELTSTLNLDVTVEQGSYRDFPHVGRKNCFTPLHSIRMPAMRGWREALADYCRILTKKDCSWQTPI